MEYFQIFIGALLGALIISVIMWLVNLYDAKKHKDKLKEEKLSQYISRLNVLEDRIQFEKGFRENLEKSFSNLSSNVSKLASDVHSLSSSVYQLEKRRK